MSYDKTNHAIISRINPKINPTLKLGHSCLVAHGDSLQFEHDIELDEELSNYTCSFAVSSDELIVDNAGEINKLVTVAGAVFIPTPSGFRNVGVAMGIQLSESVGDFTHLSDDSAFYMEENGFAVKSNVLYPIKIDRSGYEGLSGTADKYFSRGLISRKGSIDIEAWNLLDTLIDFGSSTAVKATGLRISEMDGVDCNLELIYVAEPKLDPAEIAILVPSAGDEFKLDTNFTVSGTSNCANVKIEASADGTTWVELEDSLAVTAGAFSKADCQLSSDDFEVNDTITLRVSDVDSVSTPDTVAIGTIATLTMDTPELTAGVEGTITGTSNGDEVDVYSRVSSPEGAWELFDGTVAVDESGNWTATGTIATAETYDFRAVDTTDPDGFVQVDDVVVASADGEFAYIANGGSIVKLLKSDLSLVSSVSAGANISAITHDADYVYCQTVNGNLRRYTKNLVYVDQIANSVTTGNNAITTPDHIIVCSTYGAYFYNKAGFSYHSYIGMGANTTDIARDDEYIYILASANGTMKRLNISTLADAGGNFNTNYATFWKKDMAYWYTTCWYPTYKLQKRPVKSYATLEITATIDGDRKIDIDQDYVYVVVGISGERKIQKRLKSDLSLVMEKSGFNEINNISVETTLWS